MALPERRHFNIDSAAEYLGCSISDLRHYLDEELLRCAFPTTEFEAVDARDSEKLPQELRAKIDQLPDAPDQDDFAKIRRRIPEVSRCPEFLYVNSYHRKTVLTARNELRRAIYYFESFEGQPLNIWLDGSLNYLWAERGEDGELRDTVLSKEELDRFSGISSEGATIEPKVDRTDAALNPKQHMFNYPNLADEVARLMTDQMNQYIKENGVVASENILRDFIVERTYASYDHRDKQIEIGDEEDRPVYLSFKSFKRRYNNYFGPN